MSQWSSFLQALTICSFAVACTACNSTLLRADFAGVTTGPFSNGPNGEYEQGSSPTGDLVVGSNLQATSVRFVSSFAPEGNIALMLAPNPYSAPKSPTIEFRPVSAASNHKQRTFFWDGAKKGHMTMDCVFRDLSDGDYLFTLRFANGQASLLLSNNNSVDIGSLPSTTGHRVWITLKPGTFAGRIEITPTGGTPIHSDIFAPNYTSIGGAKVNMSCTFAGFGSTVLENYVFDNLVFRSKK